MSKENNIIPIDEQMNLVTDDEIEAVEDNDNQNVEENDPLKKAIADKLSEIRTQAMLLGAQSTCQVIINTITAALNQPGKRTMNDYKRLVKNIRRFCEIGLSRTVNPDGTTTPKDENNTKLMEE